MVRTPFNGGGVVDAAVAVLGLPDAAVGERVARVVRVRAVVLPVKTNRALR